MLVSITDQKIFYWHDSTCVFLYDSNNKCQKFCQLCELNLYDMRNSVLYHNGERLFLEPVDEEKNPCTPKQKYFPSDCVGPIECTYPGVCYRFETEQQDYECSEGNECLGEDDND